MATDIKLDDDFVSVEGPLRVNEVHPLSIKELNFPSPIKVDQIRPRAQKSILFISQGIKLLRSGKFDESLGTALAHGKDDKLVINEGGGYKGGVQIAGKVTVDNLSANQFVQTNAFKATDVQTTTLSAQNIQTNILSANKGIQTDELTAKEVTIDSLTAKQSIQANVLSAKKGIQTDQLTAKEMTAESLVAKQFIQAAELSAKTITTDTLSAKKGLQTDSFSAKAMTADSLTIKQFVQTSDLGAKTVQTKSAQVTGDLVIGGKIVASKHGSIDLIALILQLQSQVADLQEQIATLEKK
jgi:hypothetical protein